MPTANINGFQMNYRIQGQGPTLVMAHGLMGSMATQAILGDPSDLLTDGFTVVNYDARGHGESGCTADPANYTWFGLAEDMYQLLRHLGIERAHIGGGSMGAGTSLILALDHPEMVDKLVLIAPPPVREEESAPLAMFGAFAQIIESQGLETAVDIAMQVPPLSDLREADPAQFQWMRQWLLSQRPEGVVPAIRGIVSGPRLPQERFGEIQVPTLILAHPDDDVHPVTSAELLHKSIPGSRLVVAPDRLYYNLHREEMAQIIRGFLVDG
jgi:3-oxoadipate enol-lactonase